MNLFVYMYVRVCVFVCTRGVVVETVSYSIDPVWVYINRKTQIADVSSIYFDRSPLLHSLLLSISLCRCLSRIHVLTCHSLFRLAHCVSFITWTVLYTSLAVLFLISQHFFNTNNSFHSSIDGTISSLSLHHTAVVLATLFSPGALEASKSSTKLTHCRLDVMQ